MALSIPCPESIKGCDCTNDPISNYSSEAVDRPMCHGHSTQPPTAGTFFAPACFAECDGIVTTTSDDCDVLVQECAARAALDCSGDPPGVPPPPPGAPGPFPPRQRFTNDFQSCTVECPDGTTFTASVPAGTINSFWKADADARAFATACRKATKGRICFFTDAALDPICADVPGTVTFDAFGGREPYIYSHTGGTLPAGMAFDGNGTLFGTPTAGGTYTFEITVTDAAGSTQLKEFTIKIVQITSPTALPNATQNSSYNYTLLSAGTTAPTSWVHVGGSFPSGLLLDLAAGVLSADAGGITESGDFAFTLRIKDGSGLECDKAFTLHVAAAVGLVGYWTYGDYITIAFQDYVVDATGQGHELSILNAYNVVPGKVGDCMSTFENECETSADPDITQFDYHPATGFTVCGWIKFDAAQEGDITIWSIDYGIKYFALRFLFDSLVMETSDFFVADVVVPYPADGDWHFFRAWVDLDKKMNLQLDNGTIVQAADPVTFGDLSCSSFNLQGNTTPIPDNLNGFDETGFWKRVLSDAEADTLWNSGNGTTYPAVPP